MPLLKLISEFLVTITPIIGAIFLVERQLDLAVRTRISNYVFGLQPLRIRNFELELMQTWVNTFFLPNDRIRFIRVIYYTLLVGCLFSISSVIVYYYINNSPIVSIFGYAESLAIGCYLIDCSADIPMGIHFVQAGLFLAIFSLPYDTLNIVVGKMVYSSKHLPSNLALKLCLDIILTVISCVVLWYAIFYVLTLLTGLEMEKTIDADPNYKPTYVEIPTSDGQNTVTVVFEDDLKLPSSIHEINSIFVNGHVNPIATFPAVLAIASAYSAAVSIFIYFATRIFFLAFGIIFRTLAVFTKLNFWLIGFTALHKMPLTFMTSVAIVIVGLLSILI